MKKLFLGTLTAFVGLFILSYVHVFAQTTCNPVVVQNLTIRGLRLGMTAEEVLALFPGASERPDLKAELERAKDYPRWGVAGMFFERQNGFGSPIKREFDGLSYISVTLLDGRLRDFTIQYLGYNEGGTAWETTDQFLAKVIAAFSLPPLELWQREGNVLLLKCGDFTVRASAQGDSGGSFAVRGPDIRPIIQERERARREQRRREFKP